MEGEFRRELVTISSELFARRLVQRPASVDAVALRVLLGKLFTEL
jgi:hypothetical protein